jgi:3-phosphoshikimate 1-carboxyvinyltransferase
MPSPQDIPAEVVVRPARRVEGVVRLPGDKSIAHRYALLAALAEGTSRFHDFPHGDDCARTLACLRALGCPIEQADDAVVAITGRPGGLQAPAQALDCGNSGSTMRLLAGILAAQPLATELTGDESLRRRPMERVITPLSEMGARIASRNGRPPLRIEGGPLHGIRYRLPVASAQVKTAVLLAGLLAEGTTTVEEQAQTRDHGELALGAFGAAVTRRRGVVSLEGKQRLRAIEGRLPGDLSSAAFLLCAAALLPGSDLTVEGVLLNPTRAAILDVLRALGAEVTAGNVEERHGEAAGSVRVRHQTLRGAVIEGAQAAALIDELPVLASLGPYTEQGIEVRGAGELRVKESDRIAAVAANLRALDAEVEERADGWRVNGGARLRGATLDSGGDHRVAMAAAVAALGAEGESRIHGAGAVAVSWPGFFAALEAVARR